MTAAFFAGLIVGLMAGLALLVVYAACVASAAMSEKEGTR